MSWFDLDVVLIVQALSTFSMLGVIWLVQLVLYPAFGFIEPSQFFSFHNLHTMRTTIVVGPLMIAELASSLALLLLSPTVLTSIGFLLVVLLWLITALVSVPLHNRLAVERSTSERESLVRRLVLTNWFRTAFWSLRASLCVLFFYIF